MTLHRYLLVKGLPCFLQDCGSGWRKRRLRVPFVCNFGVERVSPQSCGRVVWLSAVRDALCGRSPMGRAGVVQPALQHPDWPVGTNLIYEYLLFYDPQTGKMVPLLADSADVREGEVEVVMNPAARWRRWQAGDRLGREVHAPISAKSTKGVPVCSALELHHRGAGPRRAAHERDGTPAPARHAGRLRPRQEAQQPAQSCSIR